VGNPDNVGGAFRNAAAFGAGAVLLSPGCSDPLYRKAVRTSMAATLAVPFVQASAWPADLALIRSAGFDVIALTPAGAAAPLREVSAGAPRVALVVGAEGEGLSPAALDAATARARIPMTGAIDSLNVTTAASIAMYHWFGLH
jgi:tRNA G18 (ribose-2'-O)-methylase SpoU